MKKSVLIIISCFLVTFSALAQDFDFSKKGIRVAEDAPAQTNIKEQERFSIRFQSTYIYQYKPAFHSLYQGNNSLTGDEEKQNSITATLYLGLRLWKGGQLYVNPEVAGGSGLSGALGMAGSSNGETFRVGNPSPTLYLARGYLKQTFSLRNAYVRRNGTLNTEQVESDANQLAGYEPKNYLRFYLGKLCLGDLFDNNVYSNSPRTQFMNWSLMNNGAWDYAANVRGYTYAFVSELRLGKMDYKAGIALMPTVANGPKLNTSLNEAYAVNAEMAREFNIAEKPGTLRLTGYYNVSDHMGKYADALAATQATGITDVSLVNPGQYNGNKYGLGLNFDQQLSKNLGLFGRVGWNDGKYQTWCFTEIDRTASLGLAVDGAKWNRTDDDFGIALVANGISDDHRRYLTLGGSGFMLGDGTLNYAPEVIAEAYYSFKPMKADIWVTGDYQFCMNPGYNKDRGPAQILSARVHIQL